MKDLFQQYVDDYTLEADEGSYIPNENERALILDAMHGFPEWERLEITSQLAEANRRLGDLRRLSDEMAEDEGLWFVAATAPEAYLQQRLRELCALIELARPDASSNKDAGAT